MKDLSFFLSKNSVGAKMKKGIRNFCNGDGSTSTLNQQDSSCMLTPSLDASPYFHDDHSSQRPPTLEEMILQLELEEEIAKKAKLNEYGVRGRMSCVNNSDIMRSARNALNQYPRFSLDGKDAMYKSSFRNLNTHVQKDARRKSVCRDHGLGERFYASYFAPPNSEKTLSLPPTLAGESVVWRKPGVVAKLMGLEAMPVPKSSGDSKHVKPITRRQNQRTRVERYEMERKLAMHIRNCDGSRSSKAAGYRVVKPVAVEPEPPNNGGGGWPTRRFL